jgi:hypothetical protein
MSANREHTPTGKRNERTLAVPFIDPFGPHGTRVGLARRGMRRFKSGSLMSKVVAGAVGMALVGAGAYAATNWVVGLGAGSSGEAQSGSVGNLTIVSVASPSATNLLFPGGNADVVAIITNPNGFPVTITGLNLPTNTTYATGYTGSALTTTQAGCLAATPSYVIWNFSSASSGSAHALTSPLTVAANGTLTVTFTNDATMTASAPTACQATYFSMPSMTGVTATAGAGTATSSPAVDAWTS